MSTFLSPTLSKPAITASQAGQLVAGVSYCDVPATLAAADIIGLCLLPADHIPCDFTLESTDLDTNGTPTLTLTVAVLNAGNTDVVASTDFITASTIGQTGGVVRADKILGLQLAASNVDRIIGVKVANVAATKAAGTLKGTLYYRRK